MNKSIVTVITGGGRGIGEAIAKRMAQDTAVLIVGRTEATLARVCEEIGAAGGTAFYVVGDISKPETAELCLKKVEEEKLAVANLVLNAGMGKSGALTTFDRALWREIFAVNVDGAFFFLQTFLPKMVERKAGSVCIISSISGVKGFKYDAAYVASKHALVGLARSVALEYAKHGISCYPICPSFVESEMTDRSIAGVAKHREISLEEARKVIEATSPQKRIIPASEVAEMVAFLSSGKAPALNGHPVMMTGGE